MVIIIRELAMQSHQVFVEVGGVRALCIYGGVSKGDQVRSFHQDAYPDSQPFNYISHVLES